MSWVFSLIEKNIKWNKIKRFMCFECNFCEIGFKRRFTAREENNSFKKSKPEEGIYKLLLNNNIKTERQIHIDKRIVDFLLPENNVYIEVDGIYWHGIGKTKEELLIKTTPQAKSIYKKHEQDKILNKYCFDNKIKLLRITDMIANKIIKNNDIELLKQLIDRTVTEYVVCYYEEQK